jgi:hypothetical protein
MRIWVGVLGVGGPNLVRDQGWDPAPLLLTGVLIVVFLGAGARLRSRTLVACLIGGVVIDLVTDALTVSPVLVLAPAVVVMAIVALRGTTVP